MFRKSFELKKRKNNYLKRYRMQWGNQGVKKGMTNRSRNIERRKQKQTKTKMKQLLTD
jgi:hypothetical protein